MSDIVFLFGHRQQHGKNTAVAILEKHLKQISVEYVSTYFAKKLKMVCADKYGLDFSRMEDNEYKSSCPSWISPKTFYWDTTNEREVPHWVFMDPGRLTVEQRTKPRTVRDVLLDESLASKALWEDIWSHEVYKEIGESGKSIGIVSDLRYPHEITYASGPHMNPAHVPKKLVKILVHRPRGIFKTDGADNLLPDIDEKFWDHVIINDESDNWFQCMERQLFTIMGAYGI
jgi:hypothetical protein